MLESESRLPGLALVCTTSPSVAFPLQMECKCLEAKHGFLAQAGRQPDQSRCES